MIKDGLELINVEAQEKREWLTTVRRQIIPDEGNGDAEVVLKIKIDVHEKRPLVKVSLDCNQAQISKMNAERTAAQNEFDELKGNKSDKNPEDEPRECTGLERKISIDVRTLKDYIIRSYHQVKLASAWSSA